MKNATKSVVRRRESGWRMGKIFTRSGLSCPTLYRVIRWAKRARRLCLMNCCYENKDGHDECRVNESPDTTCYVSSSCIRNRNLSYSTFTSRLTSETVRTWTSTRTQSGTVPPDDGLKRMWAVEIEEFASVWKIYCIQRAGPWSMPMVTHPFHMSELVGGNALANSTTDCCTTLCSLGNHI